MGNAADRLETVKQLWTAGRISDREAMARIQAINAENSALGILRRRLRQIPRSWFGIATAFVVVGAVMYYWGAHSARPVSLASDAPSARPLPPPVVSPSPPPTVPPTAPPPAPLRAIEPVPVRQAAPVFATPPLAPQRPSPPPVAPRPPPPAFTALPLPLPADGEIDRWFVGEHRPTVKVITPADGHRFVKIEEWTSGKPIATLFIRSGSAASVNVPVGTYRIKVAVGQTWYGTKYLFGPETRCAVLADSFECTVTRQGNDIMASGWEVTLIKQVAGNLKSDPIKIEDF